MSLLTMASLEPVLPSYFVACINNITDMGREISIFAVKMYWCIILSVGHARRTSLVALLVT